mmetsp:Transcript_58519/g.174271  ORF Transcript_58519/g.174271 Transcript_58519/m.174271 type:complete len:506 (-) Transcript_58519:4-1521(-)
MSPDHKSARDYQLPRSFATIRAETVPSQLHALGSKELHIAPMLDVSTREFRCFMRLLSKRATLWTEMVCAETLVHCDETEYGKHLAFEHEQHPIVCQIGGNVPSEAAFATRLVHEYGYDAVDLNAECPSDRVSGRREFGAALMRDACVAVEMVRSISKAAQEVSLPFSVKTRIGVDDYDCIDFLLDYVGKLVEAGCRRFVIHARKVYTKGLSPAQNRSVPPLNYQRVYALCHAFPHCSFWLNGGIRSLVDARRVAYGAGVEFTGDRMVGSEDKSHVKVGSCRYVPCDLCAQPFGSCIAPPPQLSPPNLRGVMLGRLAMDNPSGFADVDRYFFGEAQNPCRTRRAVLEKYAEWLERVYPRRCCDDDPRVTTGMHLNGLDIPRVRQSCVNCQDVYGKRDRADAECAFEIKVDSSGCGQSEQSVSRRKRHARKCPGAKIVSRVIDRSLKPSIGMLHGQQGNSAFRRAYHRLSRDMSIRNCGPGFILRKMMEAEGVKAEILDVEFEQIR